MRKKRIIKNYDHVINEILKHDLGELEKEFTYLKKLKPKKAGVKNYYIKCPFHKEETPSFCWSRPANLWYCFGCHKSGNIISFFAEGKMITYFQAAVNLAKFFNIPIEWGKINNPAHLPANFHPEPSALSFDGGNDCFYYLKSDRITTITSDDLPF